MARYAGSDANVDIVFRSGTNGQHAWDGYGELFGGGQVVEDVRAGITSTSENQSNTDARGRGSGRWRHTDRQMLDASLSGCVKGERQKGVRCVE